MFQDDLVTDSSRDPMAGSSQEEQARLDAAMRRADELLVTSLKSEERQRNRRRILFHTLGGVAMLAILCALLVAFTAETEQAGRLVQEGGNLFNQQKFAEACEKYQQAVKLDPKNVIAWNGLGWSQFNTGSYLDAEESFKKVLKVAPKYAAALNGLGQLYLLQRKYDEAEKYLLKAAPKRRRRGTDWHGCICWKASGTTRRNGPRRLSPPAKPMKGPNKCSRQPRTKNCQMNCESKSSRRRRPQHPAAAVCRGPGK